MKHWIREDYFVPTSTTSSWCVLGKAMKVCVPDPSLSQPSREETIFPHSSMEKSSVHHEMDRSHCTESSWKKRKQIDTGQIQAALKLIIWSIRKHFFFSSEIISNNLFFWDYCSHRPFQRLWLISVQRHWLCFDCRGMWLKLGQLTLSGRGLEFLTW